MTIAAEPPRRAFRPSQLINDSRYRGLTIQVVALLLLAGLIAYLGHNLVVNLRALGKDFDFGFLGNRAGYDIGQTLISYTNNDTHARAALVGMLNTLLVAALGCVTATVIGVLAGVLRLSKNWLIGRLMTVYVELFRNVPLLLWIVLVHAVLSNATPIPAEFRGEGATASMVFGVIAFTAQGTFIPWPVWGEGAELLTVVLLLSILAALVWRSYARRRQMATGRPLPVLWVALAILVLPTVLAFLLLGRPVTFDVPTMRETGIARFNGGVNILNSLVALWFALALYTGAFIAEIVRGGILAVSRGQSEAAFALGLRPGRTMRLVILPQALRVIVPPLISQYLNLTKNTSLAVAVGYADLRATLGGVTMNQTGRELESILLLGLFYLVVSLVISGAMNVYNRRIALKER
ncbi:amino acid ABC transporter permease [Rubellimicrobium aerolatum]|uniref:Amino acid ABC transporter permease n=1 Tax=Rubellimicrobium aerolatum TaxID=490979 RepID=A0ABW0SD83_9RHOB|nr:ABC transporter permease subunit [Rubellimicrobium aerolatum]MBP1806788.1 general L-amino acid transport system permease protein [Rubellimicrobium aerolatum]